MTGSSHSTERPMRSHAPCCGVALPVRIRGMDVRLRACIDSREAILGEWFGMMVGNLCRFLVEIVGWVDSRLFWIEDGADLSVRCFDLCHEIELFGV